MIKVIIATKLNDTPNTNPNTKNTNPDITNTTNTTSTTNTSTTANTTNTTYKSTNTNNTNNTNSTTNTSSTTNSIKTSQASSGRIRHFPVTRLCRHTLGRIMRRHRFSMFGRRHLDIASLVKRCIQQIRQARTCGM